MLRLSEREVSLMAKRWLTYRAPLRSLSCVIYVGSAMTMISS